MNRLFERSSPTQGLWLAMPLCNITENAYCSLYNSPPGNDVGGDSASQCGQPRAGGSRCAFYRPRTVKREENGLSVPGKLSGSRGSAAAREVPIGTKSWSRSSSARTAEAVSSTTFRPGHRPGPPLKGTKGQSVSARSANHRPG